MRLTLRTLLAYRDAVLAPADNEDLHGRILKSEYAGNILRRINAVSKRSYATSTIVGKGLGGDPNAYAEYLDDVMQSEKVPEFERVCLESDEHLSELAVCHTLLSSALKEAVRVPDSLRQTAISLGDPEQREAISHGLSFRKLRGNGSARILRADGAHSAGDQRPIGAQTANAQQSESEDRPQEQKVQVQAPMVASGGGSIKPQGLDLEDSALAANVPAYLVGSSPRNWRMPLAMGALLALLGILTWQTLGPWEEVRKLFVAEASNAEVSDAGRRDALGRLPLDSEATKETPSTATDSAAGTADKDVTNSTASADPSNAIDSVLTDQASLPTSGLEATVADRPSKDSISPESPDNAVPPDSEHLADSEPSSNLAPSSAAVGAWLPKDEAERSVVLLSRSDDSTLARLQPGDTLSQGLELIVPPHYRTTIDLPGGTLWTTCGASLLTLGGEQGNHVSSLLCKSLVRGGPLGNQLKLGSPAGDCVISFKEAASTAAVEVGTRPRINGSVLDAQVYQPVLIIVAFDGDLLVTHDGKEFAVAYGKGLAIIGGAKAKEFDLRNIPAWYRTSVDRPIDRIAAEDFVDLLLPGDDSSLKVEDQLTSLSRFPKPYVAALAVQTSLMTGSWSPFTENFLVNPRLSSYWERTIDLARDLLACQATDANQVRHAFSAGSPKGDMLFNMFTGFSDAELKQDGLSMLVSQLSEHDLESRVLAWYQLKRITGKVLAYLPHDPNRASIQVWRRELATNRLQVLPVADMIAERVAP